MASHARTPTLLLAGVLALLAFRPTPDTVGPLTAKIEGPGKIAQTAKPEQYSVVLENAGDTELKGTRARARHRPVAGRAGGPDAVFGSGSRASARLVFTVTPAERSFNAYYPIHAFAEFDWQGRRQQAHAILTVLVGAPNPPRPELPPGLEPPPATASRSAAALPAPVFPPPGASRRIGTVDGYEIRLWPGRRGLLDSTLGFQRGSQRLYFHGFQARVLGAALEDPACPHVLVEAREEAAAGRYRVRHRFKSWAGPFDLVTETWIEKGALRTRFSIENATQRPWVHVHLEDLALGPWSERATRIYAGEGNVMQDAKAFRLRYNGHFLSTSYIGLDFTGGVSMVEGVDVPRTTWPRTPRPGPARFTPRTTRPSASSPLATCGPPPKSSAS